MEETKGISSRVLINPELQTDSLGTANPFRSTVLQIDQGVNGRMVGYPDTGPGNRLWENRCSLSPSVYRWLLNCPVRILT